MKCFVCDKPIEFDECQTLHTQALYFRARGNWPSAVYDPMPRDFGRLAEHLEVIICDECVLRKKSQVRRVVWCDRRDIVSDEEFRGE